MKNKIDPEQFELYENASKRIKQKKSLYNHFVIMIIGSVLLFVAYKWLQAIPQIDWFWWVLTIWIFIFVLHFIKVFITEPFMGKEWEKKQMEKLIEKQQKRIKEMQTNLENQK